MRPPKHMCDNHCEEAFSRLTSALGLFCWASCLICQGPLHKISSHSELPSARYAFSILGNALYLPRSGFYFVYKLPFSYVFSTFKTVKVQTFSIKKLLLDVMAMVFEIQLPLNELVVLYALAFKASSCLIWWVISKEISLLIPLHFPPKFIPFQVKD